MEDKSDEKGEWEKDDWMFEMLHLFFF